MSFRALLFPLVVLIPLGGCGGGGSSGAPASTASAASEPKATGHVADAPAGTQVIVSSTPGASDLLALSAAVLDVHEVGPDGAFFIHPEATNVVVSAPGKALLRAPVSSSSAPLHLEPEAVLSARITDPAGRPEEDALVLVLEADAALPLSPLDLVTGADGRVQIGRLPTGRYELLVAAASGSRYVTAEVDLTSGATTTLELVASEDDALERRFLRITGAPFPGDALAREEVR